MPKREEWSREQLIIALKLYCDTPFGKMHSRNPEIIRNAQLIHRTPSALAMKMTNFASLDPEIRSTGRKGLSGASQSDRAIWNEMTSDWPKFANEIAKFDSLSNGETRNIDQINDDIDSYVGKTRSAVIQARIGQRFFRRTVLSAYEFKCCITNLSIPELLVASHINPWSQDENNRLNPRNGLCLSVAHNRAFDIGLISISDDLRVMLSARLRKMAPDPYIRSTFCIYEGQPINLPKKFSPEVEFLKHHRETLFQG